MRRYLTLLIALLALLIVGCKPKEEVKRLEPSQNVEMQSVKYSEEALEQGLRDTLDFGKMRQGEIIAKKLEVKNEGQRPMVLLRHVTTCGCVSVLYDRKPVAPGESAVIEFELDSKSLQGWQMKLMEFYFADKGTPMKIYIEAEVE